MTINTEFLQYPMEQQQIAAMKKQVTDKASIGIVTETASAHHMPEISSACIGFRNEAGEVTSAHTDSETIFAGVLHMAVVLQQHPQKLTTSTPLQMSAKRHPWFASPQVTPKVCVHNTQPLCSLAPSLIPYHLGGTEWRGQELPTTTNNTPPIDLHKELPQKFYNDQLSTSQLASMRMCPHAMLKYSQRLDSMYGLAANTYRESKSTNSWDMYKNHCLWDISPKIYIYGIPIQAKGGVS